MRQLASTALRAPPLHAIGTQRRGSHARTHYWSVLLTSVARALGGEGAGSRWLVAEVRLSRFPGTAGVTCPALGAAGSGGGRGPSSRRRLRPQVFSRSSHARLLHHLLEGRACALVFPGRERFVHRARERVDSFRPAAGTTPAGQNSGLALRSGL